MKAKYYFLLIITVLVVGGCVINERNTEAHHGEMLNSWQYWVGVYHGHKGIMSVSEIKKIPKFVHHIETHHTNMDMAPIRLMVVKTYNLYTIGKTNINTFQEMTVIAVEEGY